MVCTVVKVVCRKVGSQSRSELRQFSARDEGNYESRMCRSMMFTEARAASSASLFGVSGGNAACIILALASRCASDVVAAVVGKQRTCATWGAQGCANIRKPRYL